MVVAIGGFWERMILCPTVSTEETPGYHVLVRYALTLATSRSPDNKRQ